MFKIILIKFRKQKDKGNITEIKLKLEKSKINYEYKAVT